MKSTLAKALIIVALALSPAVYYPAVAAASVDVRGKMTDQAITDTVDRELKFALAVPSSRIDVATVEGIVTLSGTVHSLLEKERAVRIAETVRGVRSIVDRLGVVPVIRSNEEIRRDVENALLADPVTEAYEVKTIVDGSSVTLTGTVDSWREKSLAARVASGVRGLAKVENRIEVKPAEKRNDEEIKVEIEKGLRWNRFVDDSLIVVEVKDGHVDLSGTVGSAAEKRLATAEAWTSGVLSVDPSKLDVSLWAREEKLRTGKYLPKSDDLIKKAVEDALLLDPRVSSFGIAVAVDDGSVSLRGRVDHLKAKRLAGQAARNTVGVWDVHNVIKVRPQAEDVADKQIAQRVSEALDRDPYVDRYEITSSVRNGTVYLFGSVDSQFERAQAEEVASGITGATEVRNNLTVFDNHPLTYNPYVYDWYPYDYSWYVYDDVRVTRKGDETILKDIDSELWWSPFVDADEVNVSVDDGVATLEGTVDTWSERLSAAENAFEGGAIKVINRLEVKFGPKDAT
jgi:osmotically-inducible protein OsmY